MANKLLHCTHLVSLLSCSRTRIMIIRHPSCAMAAAGLI